MTQVLITDRAGTPREWQDFQTAACYYARGKVVWTVGDAIKTFHGGRNAIARQSRIDIHPVIGVTGPIVGEKWLERTSKFVERDILYMRDRFICAYCGQRVANAKLTIDHIHPKSKGGQNTWTNAVTACKPCNHYKADRTPEEAGLKLLYVPYVPTLAEKYILKNRHILADQMEFLEASLPKTSRLFVNGKVELAVK